MADEREVKMLVPDGFRLPDLKEVTPGVRAHDRGVRVLVATYWDTETLALQRAGFGLRYRTTDGSAGQWTVKAQSRRDGPAVVREELDIDGDPGTPPPPALQRVGGALGGGALRPVVTVHTNRHIVDLVDAGGTRVAEVADDRVSTRHQDRELTAFREVEIELVGDAGPAFVDAVLQRLRRAGAGAVDATPKYVRGLRARGFEIPEGELA